MLDVQAPMLTSVTRYSNTLLVSLNNRIYFRDHPFRGAHGNSRSCYVDSGPSFPSTVTPLSFAENGRPTTSAGDTLKLDTMSGSASIDIEKGGAVMMGGDNPNSRFVVLASVLSQAKHFSAEPSNAI